MFHRMFVPLDGSSDSESVLSWLRSWDLTDTTLILFHCVPGKTDGQLPGKTRFETVEQAREYLERVARTLPIATEIVVRTGSPGDRIVTGALQAEADLVVLGWSGEPGIPGTLGDVAQKVAKTCPPPVLLVRTPVGPLYRRVRRILAPINGESRGDETMSALRGLGRDLRAELILLHVGSAESEGPGQSGESSNGTSYSDVQLNLIRQVWTFLKESIAARTVMTRGSIVEETLAHAQSLNADVVAISRLGTPEALLSPAVIGRCERAVLLYEPREDSTMFAATAAPAKALSLPRA